MADNKGIDLYADAFANSHCGGGATDSYATVTANLLAKVAGVAASTITTADLTVATT